MTTFILAFGILVLVMLGMALGVILNGRTIKGSCGGLNAIADSDKCLVCNREIDRDSPLREQLLCPRGRAQARAKASAAANPGSGIL